MARHFLAAIALTAAVACGDSGNNGSNGSTNANNGTTATNAGTNSTVPSAGDCNWGEFIAACAGGPEGALSGRAIGCTEYYEPTPAAEITQEAVCEREIWQTSGPCSTQGLNGRRPIGCCWEVDDATGYYTRHCYYDDPANLEASGTTAQTACEDAGFCWEDLSTQI